MEMSEFEGKGLTLGGRPVEMVLVSDPSSWLPVVFKGNIWGECCREYDLPVGWVVSAMRVVVS